MDAPAAKLKSYSTASIRAVPANPDLIQLKDALAECMGAYRSRQMITDMTALDVLNSFRTRTLRDIEHTIQPRGADAVIGRIRPDVVFSMVQPGLTLEGVPITYLEKSLTFLDQENVSMCPGTENRG